MSNINQEKKEEPKHFSDVFLLNFKYENNRNGPYYVREKMDRKGFAFRITPKGTITFVYIYTNRFKKRKYLDLGQYPAVTLKSARDKYDDAHELKLNGIDPIEHYDELWELEQKKWQEQNQLGTVKDLFDCYYNRMIDDGKSSASEVRRSLYANALETLGRNTPANKVEPSDISEAVYVLYDKGSKTAANRLWSYLHAAFELGYKFDDSSRNGRAHDKKFRLLTNPVKKVEKPLKKEKTGTRHLTEVELLRFWNSLSEAPISNQMTYILKLLILTSGQRVKEVVECPWSEINLNDKLWTLPEERAKNGRQHYIILSEPSIKLLEKIRLLNELSNCEDSKYLFPSPQHNKLGDKPIRFDSITKAVSRVCEFAGIEHFSPRDFRRTAKTLMGKAGIRNDLRYRIQNHALAGISKNYDFYDNEAEFRKAMALWTTFLIEKVGIEF